MTNEKERHTENKCTSTVKYGSPEEKEARAEAESEAKARCDAAGSSAHETFHETDAGTGRDSAPREPAVQYRFSGFWDFLEFVWTQAQNIYEHAARNLKS